MAHARHDRPSARSSRSLSRSTARGGRPMGLPERVRPPACTRAMPERTRSRINSFSNSAIEAMSFLDLMKEEQARVLALIAQADPSEAPGMRRGLLQTYDHGQMRGLVEMLVPRGGDGLFLHHRRAGPVCAAPYRHGTATGT